MTAAAKVEVREQPQWPKKALEWRTASAVGALRVLWSGQCVSITAVPLLPHPLSSHMKNPQESLSLSGKGWQVQRRRIIRNERQDLWMQFCSSRLWELTGAHELFLWILKVTVKSKVHISDSLRNQLCISFSNWQSKIDLKKKKACCWGSFSAS